MEGRRKTRPHTTASRIDLPEYENSLLPISTYPNISAFTERGQIVIGHMEPVGAVAIAAEGRQTLAMLRRRKDEVTEQLNAERDQQFAKQLEKVRAIAVVEPCRELSAMAEEVKRPLIAIFGRYGTQAILLAKKPGRVLWSDDFIQSGIAVKEYGARVAWTELVVANLETKGLVTRKEAVATVTSLLGYRYEVLIITPAIFVESARRAGWNKISSPFSHALAPFANLCVTENIFPSSEGLRQRPFARSQTIKSAPLSSVAF